MTPLGSTYAIDGKQLWLHKSGSGGPAVVFLPGASALGLDYLNIHSRVSEFATSVLYDRAGTGWSSTAPLPRSAEDVATELRSLLKAADVAGPYVFVAHSLGGAYARRYTQLFPDEVAGIVYLDAFAERWDEHMPDRYHGRHQKVPGPFGLRLITFGSRGLYRKMFATWPSDVRDALIARHLTVDSQRAGALERSNMPDARDEIRAAGPVPAVPTMVLTALGIDPGMRLMMSKRSLLDLTAAKTGMYEALAASVPGGEHRPLPGARHSTINVDCPDEVTQAIADLCQRI
jgi:pimeloyl-ACP methyl ester carboxylesterase